MDEPANLAGDPHEPQRGFARGKSQNELADLSGRCRPAASPSPGGRRQPSGYGRGRDASEGQSRV
jgi:hypothetical protein